ncbi:MAG: DUF2520 domain-containing protein [Saprospiraceae bacterium]|nr:DUF2520 domain-containing protein [Saprospiraceae bacterium]MCB9318864.1 DUF2520 domain-containing protein [Lewinellaceae bacterium]
MVDIGLVGKGNVGSFLASRIPGIKWILTRSQQDNSSYRNYDQLNPVDLVILAVPDQQITSVSIKLAAHLPPDTPVVHTSGTLSWKVIDPYFHQRGVLYPLMTIRKDNPPMELQFPWLVDGNSVSFIQILLNAGLQWQLPVREMRTSDREKLHLAAVFANNFTNHLYYLAEQWVKENNLDFQLLLPLIRETVHKLSTTDAYVAQTGPARRGDMVTIHRHLELLSDDPDKRFVYEALTSSLLKEYHATAKDH